MLKAKVAQRAVIYCRISDDKAGESLGIIRQQADCEKLAQQLGWTVAQIITDNDRSAYSGRARPGYNQLLAGLRDESFDGVIAWHSDRLHRRPIELEEYIHICQANGVRTQTVKGGEVDLATPEGMLRAGMLGQIARYESAHKSDRITRAHQQAAEQGRYRGGQRPFGYLSDATTPHPTEAPLVQEAYAAVLRGESLLSVSRTWNDLGLKGSRGAKFSATTVRTVLLRERNIGYSIYKGEIVNREAFTPIIDDDTFFQTKALLNDPKRKLHLGPRTRKFLLTGIAYCGPCKSEGKKSVLGTATTSSKKRPSVSVYKCRVCYRLGRGVKVCDDFITKLVLERLSRPDANNYLRIDDGTDLAVLTKEERELKRKLRQYSSMLAQDDMTPEQFKEASSITRAKLEDIEKKLLKPAVNPALSLLIKSANRDETWAGLMIQQRQSVVNALMTITMLPTNRAWSRVFHPEFVHVEWVPNV